MRARNPRPTDRDRRRLVPAQSAIPVAGGAPVAEVRFRYEKARSMRALVCGLMLPCFDLGRELVNEGRWRRASF